MTVTPVDVIIPTIGRDSLRRAVRSALAQGEHVRAVVALDAPTRRDAVDELLTGLTRVSVVTTSGGRGGAFARNEGLAATNAPIVAFLDDDDWWDEDSLRRRTSLVDPTEPFFAAGAFWHERGGQAVVVPQEAPDFRSVGATANYIVARRDLRFGRTALQSSTFVMSGELARRMRWDAELPKHQDWDFALRVLAQEGVRAAWLDAPTVHVVKDSAASVSKRLSWRSSAEFLRRHPEISGRSRSDFIAVHILRAALAERSFEGLRAYLGMRPGLPHAAAAVIALSGARGRRS